MLYFAPSSSIFLSTPSMRRVTKGTYSDTITVRISIHTLHAEGDSSLYIPLQRRSISIHTLHAEGDDLILSVVGLAR